MAFVKLGEAVHIKSTDLHSLESLANDVDLDIEQKMFKFAQDLKVIAPQAKDFLYFTCVMMHAAEASLYDNNGKIKKHSNGSDVQYKWEKVGEGIKWVCSDPAIKPYKNNNSDIFIGSELRVVHKKWVGRPLCLDHKSDSVDKIRGVIVDTVYDEKHHRVIALCALDKKNYPDLADKVATGVATNVSMGTAVGRAICSECQRVARVEKDFCDHMKMRTCYGEINLDLSPMELSLVVNGADPKAKVKHIIAHDLGKAAELLTDYLKIKEASTQISTQDLESIKEQLEKLTAQVKDLESVSENTEEHKSDAEGPTRSTKDITDQGTAQPSVIQMNPPESIPSYASDLQRAIFGANYKIASLQDQYNKLASLITKNNEESMTKKVGYFQGTVEPKSGGGTYAPDPLNQKARQEDKQMVGMGDFPNVGDVDSLMSDDESTKKSLQRLADEEERSLFREAALKKAKEQLINRRAFFQGTEEPTPGKTKYKADPINEKARKEDKNMVGPAPFPQVGDVEGLADGDLELKKKLSRAKLRAEFPKVKDATGNVNKAASAWKVYDGDNLIFQASVQQFAKVAGTSVDLTYANIANGRFGKEFLRRIAAEGLKSAVRGMTKIAQAAPPPAPAAAPAVAPEMPEPAELEPPKDEEVAGGPESVVDDISALLDEIRSRLDELKTVSAKNVEPQAAQLAGEKPADMAEFENPAAPKTASTIRRMNKTMNDNLREGLSSVIAALESSEKELSKAAELYQNRYASLSSQNRSYLNSLAIDGVREARVVLSSAEKVKAAVVKYAQATTQMIKSAQKTEEEMNTNNGEDLDVRQILKELGLDEEEKQEEQNEEDVDMDEVLGLSETSDEDDARAKKDVCTCKCDKCKKYNEVEDEEEEEEETEEEEEEETEEEEEEEEEDEDDADAKLKDGTAVKLDPKALEGAMITASDLSTKSGRASARLKLAQKGLGQGYNEKSQEGHSKGSVRLPGLEKTVSPAEFNTLEDRQKAMLELANTAPKVKKQAEQIQALVAKGELDAAQVDGLTAFGVDAEAVKYWKQYYGQSKDQASSEFATKLTQEQSKAKYASDLQSASVRCKRAYQLAGQMASKGMISQAQIDSQYEEFLKLPDAGFESIASIVDRTPTIQKQASLPLVGFMDSGEIMLPSIEKTASEKVDMQDVFSSLFPQSKRY